MAFTFPAAPTVGQIFSSGNVAWQWDGSAWRGTSTSGINFVRSDQSGTVNGTLTVTSLVETSSIDLKDNIRPLGSSIDLIKQLTGVVYDRKDGSISNEPGLIAEDVQKILPNIVAVKDGKATGINYSRLNVYLLESIKEQQTQMEALKDQITVLTNTLNTLISK